MARLARMMGLGGAVALGAGLFLTVPASAQTAVTTPEATYQIPNLGLTCTPDSAHHQLIVKIELASHVNATVDISSLSLKVNGDEVPNVNFTPDPIPANGDFATATVLVTGGQITSITSTVKIAANGDSTGRTLTLANPQTDGACAGNGGTTSTTGATTSTTGATTSTTGATTSTTAATTSTTGGSTTSTSTGATTTSTSTTLGPNDTSGTLTVSPSTVAPGGTLSLAGTGFAPNSDVTITLFSDPVVLATIKSNAAGALSGTVTIPSATATGAHRVEARGANAAGTGINLLKADLTVKAASGSIPRTGSSSDFLLPVGIAVVGLGILAFAWRERRLSLR